MHDPQVVVELAPVTEWMPLKQAPARSSNAGLAAALESLSISENSADADETKDATPRPAWDGPQVAPPVDGLWRPSPKVAGGAQGGNRSDKLCEAGVLAEQGNLQPRGKVVFIMERAHRVSDRLCVVFPQTLSSVHCFVSMVAKAWRTYMRCTAAVSHVPMTCTSYAYRFAPDSPWTPGRSHGLLGMVEPVEGRRQAIRQGFIRHVPSYRSKSSPHAYSERGASVNLCRQPGSVCQLHFHGLCQGDLVCDFKTAVGTQRALRGRSRGDTRRDQGITVSEWYGILSL